MMLLCKAAANTRILTEKHAQGCHCLHVLPLKSLMGMISRKWSLERYSKLCNDLLWERKGSELIMSDH